jgi:ABC-type uncharacterized transport system YnjBCD ATPase subunit
MRDIDRHLSISLAQTPLANELCGGVGQGAVLVCGPSGCGKSAIVSAVCQTLTRWPHLASVITIPCKPLRGMTEMVTTVCQ